MIMRRVAISLAGVFVACLACAPRADAHRLDEYLQATRVSIATVPIRLASSPGSSRTPTVRRSSSERVPSGNSGWATGGGSGAGTTGTGEGEGNGGA